MTSDVLASHFGTPNQDELREHTAKELDKMGSVDAFFDRLVKNYDLPAEYVATVKNDSNVRREIAFALAENYGTTRGGLDALRIETIVKDRGIEYRESLAALRAETATNIGAILGGTEAANDPEFKIAA